MTGVSRPAQLRAGTEIRYRGGLHTVVTVSGTDVDLADVNNMVARVRVADLVADPGFAVLSEQRAPLPRSGVLETLPESVREDALRWETHIVEVLSGRCLDSPAGSGRPEYDPATTTLRQRELAKVAQLRAEGRSVGLASLQRLRLGYQRRGVMALVDGRALRRTLPTGRVDSRVVDAVRQAIAEQSSQSTGTVARVRRRSGQILREQHGADAPKLPAQRTFYRLVERLSAGRHTFGSARTRQSLAKRPDGPFGDVAVVRPGEWMQVDSTVLDVRVVLDNGLIDRCELTWMIDLATRSITAAVLRPTTKAVDAALLLARTLTPEPMRPGWSDALRMSRSVLPHRRLAALDTRLEQAAARPVIVPETIVCDHGKVYVSQIFRAACRAMGINFQPTHKGSPWEKGAVERSFDSVGTLFAQYVAGYVGSSVEHRGERAEQHAAWSMLELQDLLDEWILFWQIRPHDGLRHPVTPAVTLTPNEQYAALIETAGYVPVPLSADDYIELLPVTWRVINAYGVKISHRCYDTRALNPYRRQHSGIAARKGLWEVHHDPYDVSQVWIRNHHDGGWITAPWTQLRDTPTPFGEQAWQHAIKMLARRGEDPSAEQEIAAAAAALLDRAEQGPADLPRTRADLRTAGRSRANTAARKAPLPVPETAEKQADNPHEPEPEMVEPVAALEIFDPFEEALKPW